MKVWTPLNEEKVSEIHILTSQALSQNNFHHGHHSHNGQCDAENIWQISEHKGRPNPHSQKSFLGGIHIT